MTDLTPETLAEWRKDAKNGALLSGVGKDRRIAVLIDALAAEKAARENAERKYGVEFDHHDETRDALAGMEARAVKAEQERDDALTLLREIQEMGTDND